MKQVKFKRKILCPTCKTGQESCAIDESSPVCPYFSCYTGRRCSYYVPLEEKNSILERLKGLFNTGKY